eukprot:13242874-Alexandrium_andersonii.AAC.1
MTAAVRLATCNVQTLNGRLGAMLEYCDRFSIDVLCLQETRISLDVLPSLQEAARSAGYALLSGPAVLDA